jgi:hypothetical protein
VSAIDTRPPLRTEPAPPPFDDHPAPVKSSRRSLIELLIGVAAIVVLAVATGSTDLLIFITSVVVIVMVHELGHFLAAKHGGMKVTEYFLGFGPRLWSIRRGETEYGVKAFPLGGYVKIPGMTNLEEVDPADEARSYRQQPCSRWWACPTGTRSRSRDSTSWPESRGPRPRPDFGSGTWWCPWTGNPWPERPMLSSRPSRTIPGCRSP